MSKSKNQAGPKKSAKEDLVVEKTEPVLKEKSNSVLEKVEEFSAKKDVQITLKRALTDREQLVFDYLLNNVGKTVFAKDLAKLLDLPRELKLKVISSKMCRLADLF